MKRFAIFVAFLVLVSAPLIAKSRKEKAPRIKPEIRKVIDPLIAQLDDPEFEVREAATRKLMLLGPKYAEPLTALLKNRPPEVSLRMRRVLMHYREMQRRDAMGNPAPGDWPTLKRDAGRTASDGGAGIRTTPEIIWACALPAVLGSPHFDSPIVPDDDRMITATRQGLITMVNRSDGTIVSDPEPIKLGERILASPVLVNGVVFVPGRSLHAIDATTGRRMWKWETDYGVSSTPYVHQGRVIAVEKGEKIVALDARTGAEIWQQRVRANTSSPVVIGDLVVVGTDEGIAAFRWENGQKRWTFRTGSPATQALSVLPDRLVVSDGGRRLFSITASRGKELWRRRIPEGSIVETPAVYGDAIFFSTSGYTFRAIRATDGEDLWTRWVGTITTSSPCISEGTIYFAAGSMVHAMEATNGDDLWRLPLIGTFSSPVLLNGTLYIASQDGVLLALQ